MQRKNAESMRDGDRHSSTRAYTESEWESDGEKEEI